MPVTLAVYLPPEIHLRSTDGGEAWTDVNTGEDIDRDEAIRRMTPHLTYDEITALLRRD